MLTSWRLTRRFLLQSVTQVLPRAQNCQRSTGSGGRKMEHYRADGVRITHDPYAPGMAEKYGMPGKTDQEGFDPYRDTVGPGIYGGIVKRDEIPTGFEWVCRQKGWNAADTWRELNGDSIWFKASTQAYIYWNKSNGVWWIDEPSGNGVYIAKAPSWAPPQTGWKALGPFGPLPSLVATFRDL